jgi:drug/metabolite transporter (DMT)-like permease
MFGIALALMAAASWGTADFLGGLSTRRLPILTVSVVSQAAGLVFTAVLVLSLGEPAPGGRVVWLALAAGAMGAVGLAALYSGLALGPMGVVAPLAALSGVVPVAVGLLGGDRPSAIQLVGVVLALAGVVFAARHRDPSGTRIGVRAVILALTAAAALGLLLVLLEAAGRDSAVWTVFTVRVGALTLLAIAVAARRPSWRMDGRQTSTLAGIGVLDNGANLLFVLAAQRGLLSLIAVLASLYPVSTVLLARAVLGERLSRIQVVGVTMALAGVAAIAVG